MTVTVNDAALADVVAGRVPVQTWLQSTGRTTRGHQLGELSDKELGTLVQHLTPQELGELVDRLHDHDAAEVVTRLPPAAAVRALEEIQPDTAAAVLREMPGTYRRETLDRLDGLAQQGRDRAALLRGLLSWPENSAAANMTPEFLSVRPGTSVKAAIKHLRGAPSDPALTDLYVIGDADTLLGYVDFRDLVVAQADTDVADLMRPDMVTVDPTADQEEAAQLLDDHDLAALPVVADGTLLGVITWEDVADILQDEYTEDAERQGGSEPLEVPYLQASPWLLWRKRVVWILVLFIAGAYTSNVLEHFEGLLDEVVALTFFIPLLIGTGGNTGTQITTTLVRAMATREVSLRDVHRVVGKELTTGTMIAVAMAIAAVIRAWTMGVGPEITIVVTVTLVAIVLWASLVASVLPLLLKKLRLDPAVVSGPMIATLVDGTGLIIYFLIARWILGL